MNQWIDLSASVLPEAVIDQFILQVVVVDNDTFNWTLNFSSDVPDSAKYLRPSEIAWQTYHAQRMSTPIDTVLNVTFLTADASDIDRYRAGSAGILSLYRYEVLCKEVA